MASSLMRGHRSWPGEFGKHSLCLHPQEPLVEGPNADVFTDISLELFCRDPDSPHVFSGVGAEAPLLLLEIILRHLDVAEVGSLGEDTCRERHGDTLIQNDDTVFGDLDACFFFRFLHGKRLDAEVDVEPSCDGLGDESLRIVVANLRLADLLHEKDAVLRLVVDQEVHRIGREYDVADQTFVSRDPLHAEKTLEHRFTLHTRFSPDRFSLTMNMRHSDERAYTKLSLVEILF